MEQSTTPAKLIHVCHNQHTLTNELKTTPCERTVSSNGVEKNGSTYVEQEAWALS